MINAGPASPRRRARIRGDGVPRARPRCAARRCRSGFHVRQAPTAQGEGCGNAAAHRDTHIDQFHVTLQAMAVASLMLRMKIIDHLRSGPLRHVQAVRLPAIARIGAPYATVISRISHAFLAQAARPCASSSPATVANSASVIFFDLPYAGTRQSASRGKASMPSAQRLRHVLIRTADDAVRRFIHAKVKDAAGRASRCARLLHPGASRRREMRLSAAAPTPDWHG